MSACAPFARHPDGRALYRQRHLNADGREVLLYSYTDAPRAPVGAALERAKQSSALRWHPLRQEWAVYAGARQARTFKPASAFDPLAPMVPGGAATEIPFADFEIAVFENRFPALSATAQARGRCEVVAFGPEAEGGLASLAQDRRVLLVSAWIDRYAALFELGLEYVLPFENRGDEAGVTLHHPHGQIYGFSFVPSVQQKAADAFAGGYDLAAEMAGWREDYLIAEAGGIAAFAPPFARFPYETWLAPRTPRRGPWEFSGEEIDGFAYLLGEMTRRYDAHFGRPTPYMLSLHAAPRGSGPFQFSAQFYPLLRDAARVKYLAAVEQATGVFTVDVAPEAAARTLRGL